MFHGLHETWFHGFVVSESEVDEKTIKVIFFLLRKKNVFLCGLNILCPLMHESKRLVQAS